MQNRGSSSSLYLYDNTNSRGFGGMLVWQRPLTQVQNSPSRTLFLQTRRHHYVPHISQKLHRQSFYSPRNNMIESANLHVVKDLIATHIIDGKDSTSMEIEHYKHLFFLSTQQRDRLYQPSRSKGSMFVDCNTQNRQKGLHQHNNRPSWNAQLLQPLERQISSPTPRKLLGIFNWFRLWYHLLVE